MFSIMNEVGSLLPQWPCLQTCVLSIKCKSFNVYVNYAGGNIMAWNCLLGSVAEFSDEMNYANCWHVDPISGAFFLFPELHMFLCHYPH